MKKPLMALGALSVAYVAALLWFNHMDHIEKWDWESIDSRNVHFPDGFVWGVASAAHQVEGGHTNDNWARWERTSYPDGRPHIARGEVCGNACEHWTRYPDDIRLMQELGVRSYRFSVSWDKIMPTPETVDTAALEHYRQVCYSLLAAGISPMVTLHHFSHPIWFEDMGGFEREENIVHFVRFSALVFNALKDRVRWWCTINEPAVYAVGAYNDGHFPPGKKDPHLAATVLGNLYKAHVEVYKAIKAENGGAAAQVGIVKNMHKIDPMQSWDLFDRLLAHLVNGGFNGSFISTFTQGKYVFAIPGVVDVRMDIPDAPNTLDFVGLNYYSHNAMDFSFDLDEALQTRMYPGERATDMSYTMYPEGIYRAIREISALNRPIIITENGVADSTDAFRGEFIAKYLYAVQKAIADGYDVRGYHYWSLTDNFEWDLGYSMRFGLYHMDFATQQRTLREGSKVFQRVVKGNSANAHGTE